MQMLIFVTKEPCIFSIW